MRLKTSSLALFSGAFAIGCASSSRPVAISAVVAPAVTSATFLDYDFVHDVHGVDPITLDQAKGRWHWRLDSIAGVVVSATEIAPTGAERSKRYFTKTSDGTLTGTLVDAYGVHSAVMTVDATGLERRTDATGFVGIDGCFQRRITADASGRRVEQHCLDPRGVVTMDAYGCERRRFTLDDRGHVISETCRHQDGTAAAFRDGHVEVRATVDELGQESALVYVDVDGRPKKMGCARAAQTFDANGRLASRRCTTAMGDFEGGDRYDYDANGCLSAHWTIDARGDRVERDGHAGELTKSDARCGVVEERIVDARGRPTGQHPIRRYELDRRGRQVTQRCSLADGRPAPCRGDDGFVEVASVFRHELDERGRIRATRCLSAADHPAPCGHGYPVRESREYGADGLLRATHFLDDEGHPALGHGVATEQIEWDFAGRIVMTRSLGARGEAVVSALGCHQVRWDRDALHRLVQVGCFGVNGEPLASNMCLDDVCWPKGTTRVLVVRVGDSRRENAFVDVAGREIRRDSCDKSRCYW